MALRTANRQTTQVLLAAALTLSVLAARSAHAEQAPASERAGMLFDEGRLLMAENKFAEACAKFAESEALDPGGGTILNLGICRRREGRAATAFKLLTEALARARADGRTDRVATAERHLAELTPELSHLTVQLWVGAPAQGIALELDGVLLDPAVLGQPMPLDPGAHQLRASRQGHEPWTTEVTLGPRADARSVRVPPLREISAVPNSTAVVPAPVVRRPPPAVQRDDAPNQRRSISWASITLLSVGGIALAGGSYFGARALSLRARSDRYFDGQNCTQQSCVTDWEAAKTSATLSNVGIGVGLVSLGVGTYLLLRPPGGTRRQGAVALSVTSLGTGARASAWAEF